MYIYITYIYTIYIYVLLANFPLAPHLMPYSLPKDSAAAAAAGPRKTWRR